MTRYLTTAAMFTAMMLVAPAYAADLAETVADDHAYILDLYKHLHENPELSFKEVETAARLAKELKSLGFDVTERVGDAWVKDKVMKDEGKLLPDVGGYGVVAVMKNGDGPTVMLRADMDALPLEEKTGLDYASKVMSQTHTGKDAPVMHACAHDSHVAILVGAARQLVERKDEWSGTLVLIGQPAEEIGLGAIAMLEDGLYTKFPKPEYVLSTHTSGWGPAGKISYTSGYALANVDSVDITVKGVGAHGSAPHMGKDPIVIGAQIINALQTLVSREVNPLEAGVVTVGSFRAGFKHNIIPDEAKLQITVRSYDDGVRKTLLDGIERIAIAQALSAGLPDDLMPEIKMESDYTPSTYNDPEMTERVMGAIGKSIGEDKVMTQPPSMGGEDFSQFHRYDKDIKTVIFWTGGSDPKAFQDGLDGKGPMPSGNHSPFFAPQPEPALKLGVQAMTAGTIELFQE
ncbi:putative amidohydrolase [Litorimonas cladophorae]|uniref:Amidohydrolase n=1 Tax=Litorimonas cladophorae TaxID=1220491 RepID=A0A918NDU5_9PROT|nr:amidohydrolase [Litorimonas cladophorae]GGX60658.1 putative amidohydrolase [Litorimonas cladophorae]